MRKVENCCFRAFFRAHSCKPGVFIRGFSPWWALNSQFYLHGQARWPRVLSFCPLQFLSYLASWSLFPFIFKCLSIRRGKQEEFVGFLIPSGLGNTELYFLSPLPGRLTTILSHCSTFGFCLTKKSANALSTSFGGISVPLEFGHSSLDYIGCSRRGSSNNFIVFVLYSIHHLCCYFQNESVW